MPKEVDENIWIYRWTNEQLDLDEIMSKYMLMGWSTGIFINCVYTEKDYCHTWLHLGYSAKLRFWQVPGWHYSQEATHPTTRSPYFPQTSRPTRELEFGKQPYFIKIWRSKVFEKYVKVTFVQLKFVLLLKLNFLGIQDFLPHSAPRWIISSAETLTSFSLQDAGNHPPTHPQPIYSFNS